MQRNKISFKGQKIFIGIDVHKSKWSVTALTESGHMRTFSQPPSAEALQEHLVKHYPDGDYHAVYESGFTGVSTYYSLVEHGISCIVIHAADVPTTQYEETMKTDRIDSEKLARSLRADLLKPVYIRDKDSIDDRSVIRVRRMIQKDLAACKARVRHMLHNHGVRIPERFEKQGQWSAAFKKWLRTEVVLLSSTRRSLDMLLHHVECLWQNMLAANRELNSLARTARYEQDVSLLRTIPGIGTLCAMCIMTEVNDIGRFSNEKQFASYLGLIPTSHSSGERTRHGEKTFRGNKTLGTVIIEASWIAVYRDHGLGCAYGEYKTYKKPQEAIVKIARKMSNIIFSVLKNKRPYTPYCWD